MTKGYITNEWDRDNLNFLLKSSPEVLKDWESQMDADDIAYAQELLAAYSAELKLESEFLRTEAELGLLLKYNEALEVIDRVSKRS